MMKTQQTTQFSRWRTVLVLFSLVITLVVRHATAQEAQNHPAPNPVMTGDQSFVPPGSTLELVVDGDDLGIAFTEGVSVGCDGNVYFSDIRFTGINPSTNQSHGGLAAGVIWRYNPTTQDTTVFRSPSGMSNGIKFDANCDMVNAEGADFGGRRISRTDMFTGIAEITAGLYRGKAFNSPNDLTIDERGRIYFTDPRYVGHESVDQPVMGVYRIDLDGSIHLIIDDIERPNGIVVSPDQKTLYVTNHDQGRLITLPDGKRTRVDQHEEIRVYDLNDNGEATFRQILIDYGKRAGVDGLTVDQEGNLWVAVQHKTRPGIYAYTPDGTEKAYIATPRPTNVGFGREMDSQILYITAANHVFRIQVGKMGYQLPQ